MLVVSTGFTTIRHSSCLIGCVLRVFPSLMGLVTLVAVCGLRLVTWLLFTNCIGGLSFPVAAHAWAEIKKDRGGKMYLIL